MPAEPMSPAGTPARRRPPDRADAGGRRPRRPSRRTLKIASGIAAATAFALPWGVLHAVPAPPAVQASGTQVVTLPGGQRVVIPQGSVAPGGVRYVYVKGSASGSAGTAAPVTTTRASGVPRP
jgi:hypothetical protein